MCCKRLHKSEEQNCFARVTVCLLKNILEVDSTSLKNKVLLTAKNTRSNIHSLLFTTRLYKYRVLLK